VEDCRSDLLSSPPYKKWQCVKCETEFKKSEISVLIQRENELSLCTRGLNVTLREGKIQKSTFERDVTEALHRSVNILGSTHCARPILHLMAGEWFQCQGKVYESAMHFMEYVRIYEQVYGHIPNPKVSLVMRNVAEQTGDMSHKLHFIRNAIWGLVHCLGENHVCTKNALELLTKIEEEKEKREAEKEEEKKKEARIVEESQPEQNIENVNETQNKPVAQEAGENKTVNAEQKIENVQTTSEEATTSEISTPPVSNIPSDLASILQNLEKKNKSEETSI